MRNPRLSRWLCLGTIFTLFTLFAVHRPIAEAAVPADAIQETLSWVPEDAALFVHVDFASLWKSKIGDAYRKFDAPTAKSEIKKTLADATKPGMTKEMMKDGMTGMAKPKSPLEFLKVLQAGTGLTIDDIATVTVMMPKLKGPGDEQTILFAIHLLKPYDKAKVLSTLDKLGNHTQEQSPGVYFLEAPAKASKAVDISIPRIILTHPQRIVILGPKMKDLPTATKSTGSKTIAPALQAARDGKTAVFSLNFAQFPDEVRGDGLPPQVEPFKPLLQSDLMLATGELTDKLTLKVQAFCPDRAKAIEAEKSMGVMKTLLSTLLNVGKMQAEKENDPIAKSFLPLLGKLGDVLKTTQFATQDNVASVSMTVPSDIDYTPVLAALFGTQITDASARVRTSNNLKQMALAMHNYLSTYNSFPTAATVGKRGKLLHSWRVTILPYVEQAALYQKFKLDEPWDSDHNKKVFEDNPMPAVYMVDGVNKPGDKETHFQVFRGNGAIFDLLKGTRIQDVTDGTSNTLLIVTAKKAVPWTKPDDLEFDPRGNPADLLLFINKSTPTAFADGSVRQIKDTVSAQTLRFLIMKSDGNVIGNDF